MNRIEYEYVSTIVACIFAASAIGAGKLGPRRAVFVTTAVLALVLVATLSGPLASLDTFDAKEPVASSRAAAIRRALALVPSEAAVSSSNSIGAHLSERRRLYAFPLRARADWVVLDSADPWLASEGERDAPTAYRRAIERLRAATRRGRASSRTRACSSTAASEAWESTDRRRRPASDASGDPPPNVTGERETAVGASRSIGRDASWVAARRRLRASLVVDRRVLRSARLGRMLRPPCRRAARRVPEPPFRPREHGAGRMEHGARRLFSRSPHERRRADVPARRSTSIRSWPHSPRHGGCGRAP